MAHHELQDQSVEEMFASGPDGFSKDEDETEDLDFPEQDDPKLEEVEDEDGELEDENEDSPEKPNDDDE